MDAEKFFKEMFSSIWQGGDLSKFDEFYAKDFEETVDVSDDDKKPIEFHMNYDELRKQADLYSFQMNCPLKTEFKALKISIKDRG